MPKQYNIWWGPPKKFSPLAEERKISWLELFYDLVYVIVISKITHFLTTNHSWLGILDYGYLFTITFWGWYNGSQYHDLHGSPGIRTRFMTLWQMMAVGALAVTLDGSPENVIYPVTISIMVLQVYITYLWWSIGIYDKHHRKLNVPYTVCYLISFVLLLATLFVPQPYKRIIFWITILLNYLPPFLVVGNLRKGNEEFSLSSSMMERLGLFTIIIFGEAILGVINGVKLYQLDAHLWFCFGLGILIVFALWWIFFSLIADRESKRGLVIGSGVIIIFIPTLSSLGMIGASFPALLQESSLQQNQGIYSLQVIYGINIAVFLFSITAVSRFLIYPKDYENPKRSIQKLLIATGFVNILFIFFFPVFSTVGYLLCVFCSLLFVIVIITRSWFRIELNHVLQVNAGSKESE